MTIKEALENCIETLKNVKVPVSQLVEIGIPVNNVMNTQININAAIQPPQKNESEELKQAADTKNK